MVEPAVGAVNLLLGVIRSEARLLRGVRADVQFIQEEMESMKSFLAHLSRTAPPTGEHNEQVRTWMDQVRRLAIDCSGCIDVYMYRGNPDIHRARGGLRRYYTLLWLPWFLRKMWAQHCAATRLRELKDRARDIADRRSRYGVEIPASSSGFGGPGNMPGENEQDGDLEIIQATTATTTGHSEDARALAHGALSVAATHFKRKVIFVDIPGGVENIYSQTVQVEDILSYILTGLELEKSNSHQQGTIQGGREEENKYRLHYWCNRGTTGDIHYDDKRKKVTLGIRKIIKEMEVDDKITKIKSEIHQMDDQLQKLEDDFAGP
ncbi:hypothetical protein PR202_gb25043 [Eleusine coracana subsp. coracana]|uniref:Disease resistance N-terminal domain-containing protein n=1 Tax=Eleusine coracana subsp. coracana TaxID=191504 RepID=A0AAV5FNA8_ELECO|nr:hypothetical protein PR202_gb25043 [Eleusine coracana subsp. coracana]